MSSGRFSRTLYEANAGTFHNIRVQPETIIAGTNAAPAGPVTPNAVSAKVSKGKREFGLGARTVTIAWANPDAPPEGYAQNSSIRLPILTPAAWEALSLGATFQYAGVQVRVIGKSPESLR